MPSIYFYCPAIKDLAIHTNELHQPEATASLGGRVVWMALTAHYLQQAGLNVILTPELPAQGIVFFHANDRSNIKSQQNKFKQLIFVCVTADAKRCYFADYFIFQNQSQATH